MVQNFILQTLKGIMGILAFLKRTYLKRTYHLRNFIKGILLSLT
jgi:hypothetical protein